MPNPVPDVTFIGLGAMGLPMARRLVDDGRAVVGVEPFEGGRAAAAASGIQAFASVDEAPIAPIVIVMVATSAQLDEVIGRLDAARIGGTTWIVMSTVGPDAIIASGARLAVLGADVIDAPVTGGVRRAASGELTIFASGDPALLDAVAPILARLGSAKSAGNALGQGQSIKVVNQHLCAVHIVVAAEALALAEGLGLDPATVLGMVETGAAASWMLSDRGPRMLEDEPAVLSQVDIFVKDTGLVAAAAASVGAETPVLAAARDRFLAASAAGSGRRDDSRVIETYPTWTSVPAGKPAR